MLQQTDKLLFRHPNMCIYLVITGYTVITKIVAWCSTLVWKFELLSSSSKFESNLSGQVGDSAIAVLLSFPGAMCVYLCVFLIFDYIILQPVLTLGLISGVRHFSGAIFQVVRNVRRKSRQMIEVLAAGGRYDSLLSQFRKPGSLLCQCVVGISIAMERVVAATSDHKGNQVSDVLGEWGVKWFIHGSASTVALHIYHSSCPCF